MVTYSDLIQIGILVVGIINLFLQVNKKKEPPSRSKTGGYFVTTGGADPVRAAPSLYSLLYPLSISCQSPARPLSHG